MTIDGFELFEIRPDFAEQPELVASRFATGVELSPARRIGFFPGKHVVHVLNHGYVLRGANIAAFEKFFNDRSGKWQTFLVPSWNGELSTGKTNSINSPSGDPDLWIDWCDYASYYGPADNRLGRYVFLLWSDGTFFAEKVTAVAASVSGDYDKLTLDSDLPKTVDVADPPVIGFVYLVRFASDEMEMEYHGPLMAKTEMGFVEVIVSEPEADVT